MPILDHHYPKIIKVNAGFPGFLSTHQKSVYFINFFLRYSQFLHPEAKVSISIFAHGHLKIFQSTYSFYEFASMCKKFHHLFYRYGQFKNPAI